MFYLLTKAALSGLIIAVVSEIAKRNAGFGALVASLPLVSVLAVIWLWRDTGDTTRVADQLQAGFWYVLPSQPMFLLIPVLLRGGMGFWPALGIGCAVTVILYLAMIAIGPRCGLTL